MRYSARVCLQATRSESKPIRIRVSFCGNRVDIALGYSYESDKWDALSGYPLKRTKNLSNQTAAEITIAINDKLDEIDKYFKRCEVTDTEPDAAELRRLLGRRPKAGSGNSLARYCELYKQYVDSRHLKEKSKKRIFSSLKLFCEANSDLDDVINIDSNIVIRFEDYLIDRKLHNSTISIYCIEAKSFVKWICEQIGLNIEVHRSILPMIDDDTKSYLEPNELKAIYEYEPQNDTEQRAKDYFIMGCFTGLRYVDLRKLRKSEITDTEIVTNMSKTHKKVRIEINRYSREVIDRYMDSPLDTILPYMSQQWLNENLRKMFIILHFDTPVMVEYYNGKTLVTRERPKYDILASHSARRTFVVQCLKKNVPPMVIIRWTGHKDLKALGPYIAIVDSQRKEEMQKLDMDL